MRFDKPRSFRKSMTWVHTWTGLPLGWLLFAVFVTGTLSFYRAEITQWMQPETQHVSTYDNQAGLSHALDTLQHYAADADQWNISFPTVRNPLYEVSWRAKQEGGLSSDIHSEGGNVSSRQGNELHQPQAKLGHSHRYPQADSTDTNQAHQLGGGWQREHGGENRWRGQHSVESSTDEHSVVPNQHRRPSSESGDNEHVKAMPQTGHRGMMKLTLDPSNGKVVTPRDTAGGNFIYQFHFQLYGMDRGVGRVIVGIATFFMLVAMISGVIVHRNIFKDFFSFRPNKGQRSWLDAHAVTSVLALPFHLILTFSGLLFLSAQLMPVIAGAAYNGDIRSFMMDIRGGGRDEEQRLVVNSKTPLTSVEAIVQDARKREPNGISSMSIKHPGKADAEVSVTTLRGSLFDGRQSLASLTYDGVTGKLKQSKAIEQSSAGAVWKFMLATHMGLFAAPVTRALLFLSGVFGSLMIASGLVMWLVSRERERKKLGYLPKGHRLVQCLNVAAIAGLMLALAAYFWVNRLIPVEFAERADWEIRSFFICWGLSLLHALLRPHVRAWIEQLTVAAIALMLLPILNGLTGGSFIWESLQLGQFSIAGFDLTVLALGLSLFYAAIQVYRKSQTVDAVAAEPLLTSLINEEQ